MILNAFPVESKVGTPIGDYNLTVVTEGAEPEEGGGISLAWIADLKLYRIPVSQMTEGTVASSGYRRLFCNSYVCFLFMVIFQQQKNHHKKLMPPNIHKKCKNNHFITSI